MNERAGRADYLTLFARLSCSWMSWCHDIFFLCWPSAVCLFSSTLHPFPLCSIQAGLYDLCGCIPGFPSPLAPSWMQPMGGTSWRLEADGGGGQGIPQLSLCLASRWCVRPKEAKAPTAWFSPHPLRDVLTVPQVATLGGGGSYLCK